MGPSEDDEPTPLGGAWIPTEMPDEPAAPSSRAKREPAGRTSVGSGVRRLGGC